MTTRAEQGVQVLASDPSPDLAVPTAPAYDKAIVRLVRSSAFQAGIFRDPGPEFLRLKPDWSPERWARASEVATRRGKAGVLRSREGWRWKWWSQVLGQSRFRN